MLGRPGLSRFSSSVGQSLAEFALFAAKEEESVANVTSQLTTPPHPPAHSQLPCLFVNAGQLSLPVVLPDSTVIFCGCSSSAAAAASSFLFSSTSPSPSHCLSPFTSSWSFSLFFFSSVAALFHFCPLSFFLTPPLPVCCIMFQLCVCSSGFLLH